MAGVESVRAACWSMGLLTAALTAGSLLNDVCFGGRFYTGPVLLIPSGIFLAVLIVSFLRERRPLRQAGFYLAHGGILLVIAGAVLYWGMGQEVTFNIPVDRSMSYGEVQTEDQGLVSFGFEISVPDFKLEYKGEAVSQYRAQLRILEPESGDTAGGINSETAGGRNSETMSGSGGAAAGTEDGAAAGTATAMRDEVHEMKVNSPVRHGGWKFYLMDYDHESQSYLTLHAKKDPGNRIFAAGLWTILIGTFLLCFRIGPTGSGSNRFSAGPDNPETWGTDGPTGSEASRSNRANSETTGLVPGSVFEPIQTRKAGTAIETA